MPVSIPSISVGRPILANLLMILVVIGGIFSYQQMGSEIFPELHLEMVTVSTVLPGASPKEVEQLLTIPIEEEISKIDEIDQLTSVSSENVSSIIIQFKVGIDSIFEKITEIQNQIEKVQRFPEEATKPDVREISPPFETLTLAVLGNAPESEVRSFVEDFRESLKTIPGVNDVDVAGLREREIWVEVDPYRLQSYGLSLRQVAAALGNRNLNLPGGLIRLDRGEYSVRTEAEFRNLDEILQTILRADREGGFVYVRDVATVSDTFAERSSLARFNGLPSVNINIKKKPGGNEVEVAAAVREMASRFESQLPAGAEILVVSDSSIEIGKRLRSLFQSFGVGLILVSICFTVAIGWRAAIIITAGLPVAFLGAFIFLNAWGYTMNQLVVFSMIIVLGLIVDDAIVVCENIYRHLERGVELRKAAIIGAEQIMAPVVATVLTTLAAFLPLLLMTGMIGQFMRTIPIVICLALVASLFEAFFILPAHVFEWSGVLGSRQVPKPRRWVSALTRIYERLIRRILSFRYLVVLATLLTALGAVLLASRMDFVLFGGQGLRSFTIAMEGRPSSSLQETERILTQLEQATLRIGETNTDIESVRLRAGFLQRGMTDTITGTHVGQITVELVDLADRRKSGDETQEEIRRAMGNVIGARAINFEQGLEGPPVGKAVFVQVKGDNFDTLRSIASEMIDFLSSIDGVKDPTDNFPPGKDEVRPILDLARVAAAGLDVETIAAEIRGGFEGIEATRIYDGNEEVEVMVKYSAQHRQSIANLAEMQFATANGLVPFSNLGEVVRGDGYSQIHHHNQTRSIAVSADVDPTVITSQQANRLLLTEFQDLSERYPGYVLELGGEWEDTQESINSMARSFLIAIVVIYVILGSLFGSLLQPLVVMFSVPLSFIGVVTGLFVLGHSIGMPSLIGSLALVGIVVNDSLILIDFVNRKRAEGLDVNESLAVAGSARLRPIILTSITTIAGLMPMSLGLFGVDQSLRPMAVSIAWGLSFATILTLVIVPCVHRIADDFCIAVLGHPLGTKRAEHHAKPTLDPV